MRVKKKVAIFDIDGTIFRSSLLIELVELLIEENIFPRNVRRVYDRAHKNWLNRKGGYDSYINAVIKVFDKNIQGVSRKDFLRVVGRVVRIHKDRIYRYTRDLIKDLRGKRYYLLAITHSPKYIADEFANTLGFDKVYGRLFEIDGRGRFMRNVLYTDLISNKALIVKRALERANANLEHSVGVGDTESDIPFLKLVRRPICFNPNSKLYRYAKRKNWEIVVERKDVVYHITK